MTANLRQVYGSVASWQLAADVVAGAKQASEPCVVYARVSSKEQAEEGFSIPAQRQLLRNYVQREGLQIIIEFSDDETAKATGRTGFGQMLAFFREHPEVRTLIVEKVDRLTRNFEDYGALKRLACQSIL